MPLGESPFEKQLLEIVDAAAQQDAGTTDDATLRPPQSPLPHHPGGRDEDERRPQDSDEGDEEDSDEGDEESE